MKCFLPIIVLTLGLMTGCSGVESSSRPAPDNPLADTLLAVFSELRELALSDRCEEFVNHLDPVEKSRLVRASERYGFRSLRSYLELQFGSWPNPDTLGVADVIRQNQYARLTLSGKSYDPGYRRDRVRYTFVLFRRSDEGWALSAVSRLDKDRYDRFGNELGYLETELPPRLRFPRLF